MIITSHALKAASKLEAAVGRHLAKKAAANRAAPAAAADKAALSDEELISQMAGGEQAALQALMGRHHARISRFIRRYVNDHGLVEDLVADTFFAAWQQAPHFEKRSTVGTWLLAIARYKTLSARERRVLPTEPIEDVAPANLIDGKLRPDDALERDDWARFLRQCLATLPPEQALLLELVYYRDKSIKEAALITGTPENTVKSRMFLARKKLAAMLGAAETEAESVSPAANTATEQACVEREAPRASALGAFVPKRLALT
jgi:RNA polymerase sigma-70 factor (ECF subfamily)